MKRRGLIVIAALAAATGTAAALGPAGQLNQPVGTAGCVHSTAANGCGDGRAMEQVGSIGVAAATQTGGGTLKRRKR